MNLLRTSVQRLMQRPGTPVGDGELLARFVQQRDQAAFELIVHRHGPMVLGLCRRLLRDVHEAEDAFQGAFLTLACRARSIRQGQSLGSWLFKVALRMCRRLQARRSPHSEQADSPCAQARPEQEVQRREEAALLAGEVERLSECLRSVVVLCYLQGKSSVEAARELGCPPNTVSIRLRRARERLKHRLARRGVVLSAGVAGTLGATVEAGVPPALATVLASHALQFSAGAAAAGLVSTPVMLLVKGALVAMWWKPIKLTCLALLGIGLVAVPVWNAAPSATAQQPFQSRSRPLQPHGDLPPVTHRAVLQEYTRMLSGYPTPSVQDSLYPPDENLPEDAQKWIADQNKQEDAIRKEAEQKIRKLRAQLYTKLRGLQDKYTKAGDLDRAVALRDQARRLEVSIVSARPDPGSLVNYRGQNGKSFVFSVVGRLDGTIWGDGVYTDDSALAVTAVHAGLVRPGQHGVVKVTIEEGKAGYEGTARNGVTSQQYGPFAGSYRIERVDALTVVKSEAATSSDETPALRLEKRGQVAEVTGDSTLRLTLQSEARVSRGDLLYVYSEGESDGADYVAILEVTELMGNEALAKVKGRIQGKSIQRGDIVATVTGGGL